MTRSKFISQVFNMLDKNGARKKTPPVKTTFHISGEDGQTSSFSVKKDGVPIKYSREDIASILDAMIDVIIDALEQGDNLTLTGIGSLYLKHRAERRAPHPVTGEMCKIKERFSVKFDPGSRLKTAAMLYSANCKELQDKASNILSAEPIYEEDVEDEYEANDEEVI